MVESSEGKKRTNFFSGLPTEPLRGYARAVQVDDRLMISGTTAINERGEVVGLGDPYLQTKFVIQSIREILRVAGFTMADVVRTRLFVTQISAWKQYARAHGEAFDKVRPASSVVQVSQLMDPRFMIEMEAEAIRGLSLNQFQTVHIGEE